MENNFKWNKTRKGGKNVYEANQPEKKKKLKRERERQTFTWIESSVCRDISLSLSQSKIEDDMGSLSALSRGEKFHQQKKK